MKNNKGIAEMTEPSIDYNCELDNKFRAQITLGKNVVVIEEVTIDEKCLDHDGNMTYDDVEDAFFRIMDKKYPEESFPNEKISRIDIFSNTDKEWVPVFSESDKDGIAECEKSKTYSKFLVLPDATYCLSPECKLWMALCAQGLIDEDSRFDFSAMHKILETMNGGNK